LLLISFLFRQIRIKNAREATGKILFYFYSFFGFFAVAFYYFLLGFYWLLLAILVNILRIKSIYCLSKKIKPMKNTNLFFLKTAYFWALFLPVLGLVVLNLVLIPSWNTAQQYVIIILFLLSLMSYIPLFSVVFSDKNLHFFKIILSLLSYFSLVCFGLGLLFSLTFGDWNENAILLYENKQSHTGIYYCEDGTVSNDWQFIYAQKSPYSPILTLIENNHCFTRPEIEVKTVNWIIIKTCSKTSDYFFY
jgi:hypothetical protein